MAIVDDQPRTAESAGTSEERTRDALTLSADNYGPFWQYVNDDEVTDCDFNGTDLWITDTAGRRTQVVDHGISADFVRAFSQRVANKVSKPFNKMAPLLEAETSTLRISILHESAAVSGRSICLRKSLPNVRITARSILDTDYMPREIMNLLVNCIRAKMNFVIGGEPGAGKTELAKFLTQFIPEDQRVITIEDSPEWHFRKINPGHDCVEMRVTEEFDYAAAIKTCLRQNPKWIALSEARGEEAKWLITSWSTGVNGVTTIHTDDIRKIPSRLIAMMNDRNDAERMTSDVFDFVNVAILVRRKAMPDGTSRRYVDQMGFLFRGDDRNQVMTLVKDGKFVSDELPRDIAFRLQRAETEQPFESADIDERVGDTFAYTRAPSARESDVSAPSTPVVETLISTPTETPSAAASTATPQPAPAVDLAPALAPTTAAPKPRINPAPTPRIPARTPTRAPVRSLSIPAKRGRA